MTWSTAEIPDLTGRRMIVTGANSGIGLAATAELVAHGADVTMAVRDEAKGQAAAALVRDQAAPGSIEVARLDLADLSSVRAFAADWRDAHPDGLDVLVNNAGVMAIPRRESVAGFELQLATNHLGPFALTGLLVDALRPDGRVVTVSSMMHRRGRIDFDDLQGAARYDRWGAYSQTKLANLLFALELHRRAQAAGVASRSIAVHPGFADTNLQQVGPRMSGSRMGSVLARLGNLFAQSAEAGAWPTLMAATDPAVPSGTFVGPKGWRGARGAPGFEVPADAARDPESARRLWELSTELTGVEYPW